jgi:low affinity Fe/Cu permease
MGNKGEVFQIGEVDVYFKNITLKDKKEIDSAGVRMFNRLIKDPDMMTVYETKKMLEKRGVNLNEIQQKQDSIYQKMVGLVSLLGDASKEQEMDINESINTMRNDLMRSVSEISVYLENTIEREVENSKIEQTIQRSLYRVVEDDDDRLYYEDIDAINAEDDDSIISLISAEYNKFIGRGVNDESEISSFIAELEDSVAKMVQETGAIEKGD